MLIYLVPVKCEVYYVFSVGKKNLYIIVLAFDFVKLNIWLFV